MPKKWSKEAKKPNIEIDRHIKSKADKSLLPEDAYLTERRTVISQDIKLFRQNTEYEVLVFYSPSEKKTYTIKPEEYKGYYGNDLKSLAVCLYHICNVSRNKLREFFATVGINIPSGSMNNILAGNKGVFVNESTEILYAGLQHLYCQIDATGSRENGVNQFTQVMCNELFSYFSTFKRKSRLYVLAALQGIGKEDLKYSYNDESIRVMKLLKVSGKYMSIFSTELSTGKIFDGKGLEEFVKEKLPSLGKHKNIFNRVKDAFAIGHYHSQEISPIIKNLLSDHAPEYDKTAKENQGLCWVHDGRNYKKNIPSTEILREELELFLDKYWGYYQKLLYYKENPSKESAIKLEKEFDELFATKTCYTLLNQRIEKTYAQKEKLLLVLKYPSIPLHNNMAELGARAKVRKKDTSFHTMSRKGTILQDAFLTITETAKKLNVSAFEYISDRINNTLEMPSLAEMILAKIDSS